MRLADFILANIEPILVEWEAFASSIWPGASEAGAVVVDPAELRDDAEAILRATARDMKSPQTKAQQASKSKGHGKRDKASQRMTKASTLHAVGRVGSGFNLKAVI